MNLTFHHFELDPAAFELRKRGEPVHLERRPLEALIYLVARRGELVTREELIQQLWGSGVVIEFDTAVNTLIRKIRQALEDSVEQPVYLETVPRKGYRFIARVEEVARADAAPLPDADPIPPPPPPSPSPTRRIHRRWLAMGALAMLAMLVAAAWLIHTSRSPEPLRVAILAFETLGPDDEHDYLAHGLAEDTNASLAQLDPEHLEVVGPMSTLTASNAGKDLATLRDELNLTYAVKGTLRIEAANVRVTTSLIRAKDLAPIWTATFDRELTSVLGLQRELSAAIARQIQIHASPEREAGLARRQTANPEAYDLYLRGRHAWSQLTATGNRNAAQFYERALAADPTYALAWAGLAMTFSAAPMNGDSDPAPMRQRARAAALRAIELAPQLTESQFALGYYEFWLGMRWPQAAQRLRNAIELDPNNGIAHMLLGHVLSQGMEHVEARTMMQRSRELDPLFPMTYALSSQVAFQAREFTEAHEFARQAVAIDPQFWIAYMQLGQVLEQLEDYDAALTALDRSIRLSGNNSKPVALRGYTLARMGRIDEARAVLRELTAGADERYIPAYALAIVHAGLGDENAAREWLERSLENRDVHLAFLPVDPKWDIWREQPWFVSLIERCAFASERTRRS